MGCGCGGSKNQVVQFKHVAPDGTETITRSQVEARARKVREGGTVEKVTSTK